MKRAVLVIFVLFISIPSFAVKLDKADSKGDPPVYTRINVRPVDPNYQPNPVAQDIFVPEEPAPAWVEEEGGHWKLVTVLPNMAIAVPKQGVDLTSRTGNRLIACGNGIAYMWVPRGKFIPLSTVVSQAVAPVQHIDVPAPHDDFWRENRVQQNVNVGPPVQDNRWFCARHTAGCVIGGLLIGAGVAFALSHHGGHNCGSAQCVPNGQRPGCLPGNQCT